MTDAVVFLGGHIFDKKPQMISTPPTFSVYVAIPLKLAYKAKLNNQRQFITQRSHFYH